MDDLRPLYRAANTYPQAASLDAILSGGVWLLMARSGDRIAPSLLAYMSYRVDTEPLGTASTTAAVYRGYSQKGRTFPGYMADRRTTWYD